MSKEVIFDSEYSVKVREFEINGIDFYVKEITEGSWKTNKVYFYLNSTYLYYISNVSDYTLKDCNKDIYEFLLDHINIYEDYYYLINDDFSDNTIHDDILHDAEMLENLISIYNI